ncbi:aminotransferase class I/II-fold pyridoxal phosphate-dependent enzyme [Cupriavidus basilensis]
MAERTGSVIVVDESHSLGTHGPAGAGLVAQLGLSRRVHFQTASLAKAFGGRAGLVTCPSSFKGYFAAESRPAIFSSGLLHHELAWFDAAADFIAEADERRTQLHAVSAQVRNALSGLGYRNVSAGSEQIIALESGTEEQTLVLRNALQSRGIFGAVFCAPRHGARPRPDASDHARLPDRRGNRAGWIQGLRVEIRDEVNLAGWRSSQRSRARPWHGRRWPGSPCCTRRWKRCIGTATSERRREAAALGQPRLRPRGAAWPGGGRGYEFRIFVLDRAAVDTVAIPGFQASPCRTPGRCPCPRCVDRCKWKRLKMDGQLAHRHACAGVAEDQVQPVRRVPSSMRGRISPCPARASAAQGAFLVAG